MKRAISLISICSLLAVHGSVLAKTYEEYKDACIEKMGLTEEQIATRLFDYQIGRCTEFDLHRDSAQIRLMRLMERNKKILSRARISSRAGKQVVQVIREKYQEGWDERQLSSEGVISQRARRRVLGLEEETYKEQKKQRALTRRERAKAARTACIDVQTSFRPNCVREQYRMLGESKS